MITNLKIVENASKTKSMNPLKFGLWLFMITIVMIFASLTSAYIVRESAGNWVEFNLPIKFWHTTVIILASSGTMIWGQLSYKKKLVKSTILSYFITIFLGVLFLVGQLSAWESLVDANVYFVGNPSGSFLYVLTGVHGFHIVSGIIYLLIVLVNLLKVGISVKTELSFQMCATYWHFLGGIWLYLFIFLLLSH